MNRRVTFIARETPFNAHAMNVLLASLEKYIPEDSCRLRFCKTLDDIITLSIQSARDNRISVIAWSFHSNEAERVRHEIGYLKIRLNHHPAVYIAGGAHVTARPEEALDMGFDTVFCGEGEQLIVDYISELIRNSEISHPAKIRMSNPHHKINLDLYPALPERMPKLNSIEITRGCIYACRFCQTSYLFGGEFRHRSLDSVLKYAQILIEKGGHYLRMITPSALSYGSPDKEPRLKEVEQLLKGVRKTIGAGTKLYYGTFPSEIRPEHISREALQLLKQYVDNDNIILGIQSGSEKNLRNCHREYDPAKAVRAAELSLESGFKVNVDVIFGLPGEDQDDRLSTIRMIRHLSALGAKIHAHWFMPLPGTPFEYETPAPQDPDLIAELDTLTAQGKLYGQWKAQLLN